MQVVKFRTYFLTVTCAVLLVSKTTLAEVNEDQLSPVVQTESGAIVGTVETLPHGKTAHQYLGIPYAEPPVGDLRFADPKPVKPWSGTKQTTEYGASCMQSRLPIPGAPTGNVYVCVCTCIWMCDDPRVEKSAAMPAFGSPRRRNASLMNFAIRTTRLLYLSSSISSDEFEVEFRVFLD